MMTEYEDRLVRALERIAAACERAYPPPAPVADAAKAAVPASKPALIQPHSPPQPFVNT